MMVPDTTAPTVNATVIILKNRFHIIVLLSRYSPGSSPAANTGIAMDDTAVVIVATMSIANKPYIKTKLLFIVD